MTMNCFLENKTVLILVVLYFIVNRLNMVTRMVCVHVFIIVNQLTILEIGVKNIIIIF